MKLASVSLTSYIHRIDNIIIERVSDEEVLQNHFIARVVLTMLMGLFGGMLAGVFIASTMSPR